MPQSGGPGLQQPSGAAVRFPGRSTVVRCGRAVHVPDVRRLGTTTALPAAGGKPGVTVPVLAAGPAITSPTGRDIRSRLPGRRRLAGDDGLGGQAILLGPAGCPGPVVAHRLIP